MDYSEAELLWGQIREFLSQHEESRSAVGEAFLEQLQPRGLTDKDLLLITTNKFAKQWVESKYLRVLQDALASILGQSFGIYIELQEEASGARNTEVSEPVSLPMPDKHPDDFLPGTPGVSTINLDFHGTTTQSSGGFYQEAEPQITKIIQDDDMVPEVDSSAVMPAPVSAAAAPKNNGSAVKTFENYVVGDSNNFAFFSARGVAEQPGDKFNPLFIYGRSGLGKTHLLLAIRDYVSNNHSYKTVVYAQASDFVNDFTAAMNKENYDISPAQFRIKYQGADVLLLDDIQHLEGKEGTINALFDILNKFIEQNKQIVLSADRAPNEIDMDERFTSRFGSGITAGIQPPSYEMKHAIFTNHIKHCCRLIGCSGVDIPPEVTTRVIELSGSNIRELEGATLSLVFYMIYERQNKYERLSIEEAERIVDKVFQQSDNRKITIRMIQSEVEQFYNVSHSDLLSSQRPQNISYPRQVAMYLSRELTTNSYPEIGKAFGGKDHTTVMYAMKTVEGKYLKDPDKKREIERLREHIRG